MTLESLLTLLVVGAVAGSVSGIVIKGKSFGFVGNIAVGMIGALLGGLVFQVIGARASQIIFGLVSSLLFLSLLRFVKR